MRKELWTRWGKNMDPEHVLDEYPRPGMVRDSFINLNGYWDYAISNSGLLPEQYEGKILVPFSPEAPLSSVNRILQPDQYLHYSRKFRAASMTPHRRMLLHFGAVDCICTVYVNRQEIGSHTGGYLPFTFDITENIREGENLLLVVVRDPSDTSYHAKGKQSLERGGMWYTPQSGIWQSVWMEEVPESYISSLKLDPDLDDSALRVRVLMSSREKIPVRFTVRLRDRTDYGRKSGVDLKSGTSPESGTNLESGRHEIESRVILEADGLTGCTWSLKLPTVIPWTPENPLLYDLEIQAGDDKISSYFAMRKISMERDAQGILRLFLNGRPYYQNGVLDQGYYPDGLYTAPSDEAMVNDILRMKALGFNMLRKHIKIEPERWYYHCDRLGMLVWQDMVCGGDLYKGWFVTIMPTIFPIAGKLFRDTKHRRLLAREKEEGRKEFLREVGQTIRHLYNHPSIVLWVPFNEGWGQFDARKVTAMIRKMDPGRLVDEASGWFDQGGGDLYSIHNYFRKLKVKLKKDRCVALTEFGGYSWHMQDRSWGSEEYGYKKFPSREELTKGIEKLWKRDLLPNVEKGLSASVYTQVSDIEDETNGLLTYDREEIKVDAARLAQLNAELNLTLL